MFELKQGFARIKEFSPGATFAESPVTVKEKTSIPSTPIVCIYFVKWLIQPYT